MCLRAIINISGKPLHFSHKYCIEGVDVFNRFYVNQEAIDYKFAPNVYIDFKWFIK